MNHDLIQKAEHYGKKYKKRRLWKRTIGITGLILAFSTAYALVLPAITQERQLICGYEEHIHTDECLTPLPTLICTAEENHTHDSAVCFTQEEGYICGLEETPGHTHDDACYTAQEVILCDLAETEGHTHSDGCYTEQTVLSCGTEESTGHIHTDSCYGNVLVCSISESSGHTHSEACHDAEGALICGNDESVGHTHHDSCYESQITCGQSEGDGAHTHSNNCYISESVLTCTQAECDPHTHTDSCKGIESILSCGQEEHKAHSHTDACKGMVDLLICTEPENHIHDDSCYETPVPCELEEHTHVESCYAESSDPNADLESSADWEDTIKDVELTGIWADDILAIAKSQIGYEESTRNFIYDDNYNKKGYTRYGDWYGVPYGDWCAMFVAFCLEYANISEDVFPRDAACDYWVDELIPLGLYAEADEYTPVPGDLIFYDWDDDPYAEHIGIVAEVSDDTVTAIEGNTSNMVAYRSYDLDDSCIIGYGMLPENPDYVQAENLVLDNASDEPAQEMPDRLVLTATADNVIATAEYGEGILPEGTTMTVTPLPDSEEHTQALEQEMQAQGYTIKAIHRFDITFYDANGNEIEPNGNVSISLSFNEPLADRSENDLEAMDVSWNLLHLPGDKTQEDIIEDVTTVLETTDNNQLQSLQFESDSFSEYDIIAFSTTETNLETYLNSTGGSLTFSLFNLDGTALPKDENGNFIVSAGDVYSLSFNISAPNGILSGTYYYQIPPNYTITAATGDFVDANGESIGQWQIEDNGKITFVFLNSNKLQDIRISGSTTITFENVIDSLEVAGDINVNVVEPPDETETTEMNKWGSLSDTDTTKINWGFGIKTSEDSDFVGNTITDTLTSPNQYYSAEDMAKGVEFGFTDPDTGFWHSWVVTADDPNMIWTETGWTYTIPNTPMPYAYWADPDGDGEYSLYEGTYVLENEDCQYWVSYTSTIRNPDISYAEFTNQLEHDGIVANGWVAKSTVITSGTVVKTGEFVGDINSGSYVWNIQASIPAWEDGAKAAYSYSLSDKMLIAHKNNGQSAVNNDLNNAAITATYVDAAGQAITVDVPDYEEYLSNPAQYTDVPFIVWNTWQENTETDTWDSDENNLRLLKLMCRCECTKENCNNWDAATSDCKTDPGGAASAFCECWTFPYDVTFNFRYETPATDLINSYGGMESKVQNYAELALYVPDNNGNWTYHFEDSDIVELLIPGMFKKSQLSAPNTENQYTATFNILLNDAMLDLSAYKEVTITDTMSETLVYIPGTLVVQQTDAAMTSSTLEYGKDYLLKVSDGGNGFVVKLIHPGPYLYSLNYDAIIDSNKLDGADNIYSNTAHVSIDGQNFYSEEILKHLSNFTFTANSYIVTIEKTNEFNQPLPNTEFGLFAENGELIESKLSDENGFIEFHTDVESGVIFQKCTPYYIREITPVSGYILDETKHWFFFCDETVACDDCHIVWDEYPDAQRIGKEGLTEGGTVETIFKLVNYFGYELPETGGPGTTAYTIAGLALMSTACGAFLHRHRKRAKEDPYTS